MDFKRWYEGEFTPYENEPGSLLVRIGGDQRRPLAARILGSAFSFYARNWKWCIATGIAVAALAGTFVRHG